MKNNFIDIIDNFSRGKNDKFLKKISSKNVQIININILNKVSILKLSKNYEYIYHLAAIVGVKNVISSPYKVLNENIILTQNIISLAQRQKKLKRFVFFSTSEVYAAANINRSLKFPTPENTSLVVGSLNDPRNTYSMSKFYGEALCNHANIPHTIIRPHNFYGERMGMAHVIPELIKKMENYNKNVFPVYSANHIRTFIYIDDAINIIIKIVKLKKTIGEAYNVGTQSPKVSIYNLAKIIKKTLKKNFILKKMDAINNSPPKRCPDISKIKKLIKINRLTNLEIGINKCHQWYKKQI